MYKTLNHLSNIFKENIRLKIGSIMIIAFILIGFVISAFAPFNPEKWNLFPRDLPPSLKHILGTSSLGQDVFWFLTFAIRNSLLIGIIVASIGTVVGVIVGLIAGFYGGLVDRIIMTLTDAFIATPALPVLILLGAIIKGKSTIIILSLIIAIFNWAWPARQVRAMSLSLREMNFVNVAKFSGMGTMEIVFSDIIPHVLPWAAANFTNTVLVAIGTEAGLAILGLTTLEKATLGSLLYWSLQHQAMFRGIWWWIAPGVLSIVLIIVSLFLFSTGLSSYLSARRLR